MLVILFGCLLSCLYPLLFLLQKTFKLFAFWIFCAESFHTNIFISVCNIFTGSVTHWFFRVSSVISNQCIGTGMAYLIYLLLNFLFINNVIVTKSKFLFPQILAMQWKNYMQVNMFLLGGTLYWSGYHVISPTPSCFCPVKKEHKQIT